MATKFGGQVDQTLKKLQQPGDALTIPAANVDQAVAGMSGQQPQKASATLFNAPGAEPQKASAGMFDASQPPPADPNSDMKANAMPGSPPPPGPTSPDPFGAMGGGVWTGSGWVTKDHPAAQNLANDTRVGAMPGSPPPPGAAPGAAPAGAPTSPDPFTAMGGGVWTGSGWVTKDHPAAQGVQPTPGATPQPTASQPPPVAPSTPSTPVAPLQLERGQAPGLQPESAGAPETVSSAYKDALLKMMNEGSGTASLDDPALKGQADAFSVQQTRAKERAREALAERRSRSGQLSDLAGSGAFDRDIVGLEQAQGEAQAGFNAGLLGDDAKRRQSQLLAATGLAGNQLNADQGRALTERLTNLQAQIQREGLTQQGQLTTRGQDLQKQLAELQASVSRQGIAQQGALGSQELGLRDKLGSGQLNLGLLQAMMGNEQFGQNLGAQLGMFGAGQDNAYQMALLNALR